MSTKPDNKLKDLPPLDTEAATRQQDPWNAGFMGPVLTNDPLLLERGEHGSRAFELYRDLKRDGKVFAALQKRKLAVIGREWTVKPLVDNEQGERDARLVTDILQGFAFDRLCSALLDAIIIGWQPAEVVWTLKDLPLESGGMRQVVAPARVPKRLQRRFIYKDTEDGQMPELRLLTREQMQDGVPVLPRKFIVHTIEGEDGNPYGSGLGLQLFWPVFFKRKGVLSWNKFCDRFGTPTPWGKYPRSASAREKGTLFDALRAFSNDGFVMTPEGTMIELLESKLSSSGLTPNQSLVEYMDDWIAEVLLGQAPRGGSGGALAAAANEREDVRLELSQADSDLLSETLNATLIKWICELNGLQECVVYRSITKEADLKLESETDVNVASLGFKPSLEHVRGKYGDGWEEAAPAAQVSDQNAESEDRVNAKAGGAAKFDASLINAYSMGIDRFARLGMKVPEQFIRKVFDIPLPHGGEKVLVPQNDAVSNGAALQNFAESNAPATDKDAIDALIEQELSQWQPVMEPMVSPVRDLMQRAAEQGWTAQQLLDELPKLLPQMDDSELMAALLRTSFAARVGAAAGVENE